MIQAKIKDFKTEMELEGDVSTIVAETGMLLKHIQKDLESKEKGLGETYAETIKAFINAEIIFDKETK